MHEVRKINYLSIAYSEPLRTMTMENRIFHIDSE